MNEFAPVTKLTKDRKNEIPVHIIKTLEKVQKITARGPLSVFERSIESRIIESVCKIVLFVIAINWFSPNITLSFLDAIFQN